MSDKIGDAKDVVVGAIKDTSAAVSTFATKWVENAPANAGISSPMFVGSQIGDSLTNSLNTSSVYYNASSAYFNTPSKHNYENNYRNNAGISSPMFAGSQIGDSLTNSLNTSSAYFNTPSKHNYENNYRNNAEVVPSNDTGVATPLNVS